LNRIYYAFRNHIRKRAERAGVAQLGQSVRLIIERSRAQVPPPAYDDFLHYLLFAPGWCNDLSRILEDNHAHATVFVTGVIADRYPSCITAFPHYVDIGSQGYTYTSLNSISDYTLKLEDIRNGKQAIDDAGSIDSKLFKAPYGDVDENIYSLLRRSQIVAEFSYPDHYNLYQNGTFIKYELIAMDGLKNISSIDNANGSTVPQAVNFYNYDNLSEIDNDIKELRSRHNFELISSSDLAYMNLTVRHYDNKS
jgi:hypothetical protein